MAPKVTNRPNLSEQIDNTPIHQEVDISRRFPFQSEKQLLPQPRSNTNQQQNAAENSSDDQEPRTNIAPRRTSVTTSDLMLVPPKRASIGKVSPGLSIGRQQQRCSQAAHGPVTLRRYTTSEYSGDRRISSQEAHSHRDDECSQCKNAIFVSSYFKDRQYPVLKNESFETLLLRYETCARQLSLP